VDLLQDVRFRRSQGRLASRRSPLDRMPQFTCSCRPGTSQVKRAFAGEMLRVLRLGQPHDFRFNNHALREPNS
jgi:hypothetical protein